MALKVVVTPVLIGGVSLAGRRWGHQVGGWLVALPLTSGPVAFILATGHGAGFAASAAVGMLAATISQVPFAMAYRSLAGSGWMARFAAGCASFAVVTVSLSHLDWSPLATFALVAAVIASAFVWIQHAGWSSSGADQTSRPPRWDIPLRMTVATLVVLAITTLAPIVGPHLAGLLSPFPVFAVVLALSTHSSHGPTYAVAVLDGLVIGLTAPAVCFAVLALTLPSVGLIAFAMAAGAALLTQACTMFLVPADRD